MRKLALCTVLIAALPLTANAVVLFSQAVDTTVFGLDANVANASSDQHPADNFVLASDATVDSIGWFGGYVRSADIDPHDFRIRLYAHAGPGPELNPFFEQVVNVSGVDTGLTNGAGGIFEYSAAIAPLALLGGVEYWVEILEAEVATTDLWRIAEATPDSGGLTRRFDDADPWTVGQLANSRGSLAFNINGTSSVDTPEPAPLALLAAGTLLLVARRGRRRSPSS